MRTAPHLAVFELAKFARKLVKPTLGKRTILESKATHRDVVRHYEQAASADLQKVFDAHHGNRSYTG
jgi:hypothetical protein